MLPDIAKSSSVRTSLTPDTTPPPPPHSPGVPDGPSSPEDKGCHQRQHVCTPSACGCTLGLKPTRSAHFLLVGGTLCAPEQRWPYVFVSTEEAARGTATRAITACQSSNRQEFWKEAQQREQEAHNSHGATMVPCPASQLFAKVKQGNERFVPATSARQRAAAPSSTAQDGARGPSLHSSGPAPFSHQVVASSAP